MTKCRTVPEGYYTVREAAARLCYSEARIKVFCQRKEFPGVVKHRGYWIIPKQSLNRRA